MSKAKLTSQNAKTATAPSADSVAQTLLSVGEASPEATTTQTTQTGLSVPHSAPAAVPRKRAKSAAPAASDNGALSADAAFAAAIVGGSPERYAHRFIDPCTDFGFKRLFVRDSNKDLLASLLNSVLPDDYQVKTLTFRDADTPPAKFGPQKIAHDIYCENDDGEHFIVELQVEDEKIFEERSIVDLARIVREQIPIDDNSRDLKAAFFIGILNFKSELEDVECESWQEVLLSDNADGTFPAKMQMYFLQLPLFDLEADELDTSAEKWFYLLKHLHGLRDIPAAFKEAPFEKVFKEAEILAMSPKERLHYSLEAEDKVRWKSAQDFRYEKCIHAAEDNLDAEGTAEAFYSAAKFVGHICAQRTFAENQVKLAKTQAKRAEAETHFATIKAWATSAEARYTLLAARLDAKLAKVVAKRRDKVEELKYNGLPAEIIAKLTGVSLAAIAKL
jgi:predicted transposase/invertase (TIGR01784 family)